MTKLNENAGQRALEQSKLKTLTELEGYEHFVDMLDAVQDDSCIPGICMNPDCDATYSYEPDSTSGWCDSCETNSVKSCMVLAGII